MLAGVGRERFRARPVERFLVCCSGVRVKKGMSAGSVVLAVIAVVAIALAALYLKHRKAAQAPAAAPPATSVAPAASSPPPVSHPIEQALAPAAATTAPPPPPLQSDEDAVQALGTLLGGNAGALLVPEQLVGRIVATVDALPRRAVAPVLMPVHPPRGAFTVAEAEGRVTMDARNTARYAPYMAVLAQADPDALVAWYVRAYPLFQQAYQELGYPHGYFNDRLIVVIDDLLAAPTPAQPPLLQVSRGYYRFVDPSLEALSAGQKLLLRLGPDNAAQVKAKLRVVRAVLVGRTLPASP